MQVIATIRTDFPTKFGIPRQSGIVDTLRAKIVFEPAYRNPDALRGLEDFSHVWLIWQFSGNARRETWSPTVRPPRLGGNTRMGYTNFCRTAGRTAAHDNLPVNPVFQLCHMRNAKTHAGTVCAGGIF